MSEPEIKPVRIGVVGLGGFGRLHALTLARLAEARLVTVVDRNQEKVDALLRELPGAKGWVDFERALRESDAEAWVIATTTASHVDLARAALAAGKTVLVEKPLSGNVEAARSLAPLVKPNSSNLMLGHIVLFNSEVRTLLGELRNRGPIRLINAVRHRPIRHTVDFVGESPLHVTMIHDLYVVQAMTHATEPVYLKARVSKDKQGRPDLALAWLQWKEGLCVSLTASFLTPGGMPAGGFDRMEVFGDGWAARLQSNPRPLEWWDDRAAWPMGLEMTEGGTPAGMLAEELRCFCRVVRGIEGVPFGATYAHAMQVMGWLDRLEHSAKES